MDVEGKSHVYVVNLYRPPQMQMSTLQTSLCQILSCIPADSKVVLIGDFKVNPSSTDHLLHVMRPLADFSLVQKVTAPTHRLGSVFDHVYIPSSFLTAPTLVLPMYFTDHPAVVITLPFSSSTSSQNLSHRKTETLKREKISRISVSKKTGQTDFPVGKGGEKKKTNGENKKTKRETRNDVYETLCPQPFACQEGFISFQCPNLQRAITQKIK